MLLVLVEHQSVLLDLAQPSMEISMENGKQQISNSVWKPKLKNLKHKTPIIGEWYNLF